MVFVALVWLLNTCESPWTNGIHLNTLQRLEERSEGMPGETSRGFGGTNGELPVSRRKILLCWNSTKIQWTDEGFHCIKAQRSKFSRHPKSCQKFGQPISTSRLSKAAALSTTGIPLRWRCQQMSQNYVVTHPKCWRNPLILDDFIWYCNGL